MGGEAVIDANVAIAWLMVEPGGSLLDEARNRYRLVVPSIWRLEVANSLLKFVRQRRQTGDEADIAAKIVDDLDVRAVDPAEAATAESLIAFARPHQLSSYDAVYLALAIERGATLFTNDANMLDAARRLGVVTRSAADP